MTVNEFVLKIATINGTGSQSANNILLKSIFRLGLPCAGKNLFPSNIFGLPTWFIIRVSEKSYVGSKNQTDICVGFNKDTITEDIQNLQAGGYFIYNADLKFDAVLLREDVNNIAIPCRELLKAVTDQVKLKKYLSNMIYVGVLAELLKIDPEVLITTIKDSFESKGPQVLELNMKAILAGVEYVRNNSLECDYKLESRDLNTNKILIDGNTATGLGMVFGGCSFASWYPITPSSSVCESFEKYAEKFRVNESNQKNYALIQAEDELSAIAMVVGASWAGARAMTATSGPGISLMAEAVGYSYFAEIPSVIWNVQRMGPSTGLPTRTSQGDILFMNTLGHGDTRHPILIPGTPKECFEDAQNALDLAERLQSFVGVASDLDLGMNFSISDSIEYPQKKFDRGKILNTEDAEKLSDWGRYKDVDGDFIPFRTLPNNENMKSGYFTRGTGHNEYSKYTESPDEYVKLSTRLKKKYLSSKKYLPKPIVKYKEGAKIALLYYGSTMSIISELKDLLFSSSKIEVSSLRIRALPFSEEVVQFIEKHDKVFVIEQNRDGQIYSLLLMDTPELSSKLVSICHFNGLPIAAHETHQQLMEHF